MARRTLLGVLDEGLPAATEFLEPTSPQYISDAVSWGAIGARNTESQVHRQLASGLSMPIGFKNATDGSIKAPTDSCFASAQQHTFFGIDHLGRAAVVKTLGNPDCHVVLRGSSHGPNYDADSIAKAMDTIRAEMPTDSAVRLDNIKKKLNGLENITENGIKFVSKEETLESEKEKLKDYPSLLATLEEGDNPYPD